MYRIQHTSPQLLLPITIEATQDTKMSEQGGNPTNRPRKNTDHNPNHHAPGQKNKRSRHQRNRNNQHRNGKPSGAGKAITEEKVSRALSWALRHAALQIGLTIREDGYVPVQEILDSTHPKLRGATLENIQKCVENSDKKRFKLEERPLYLFDPREPKETDPSKAKTILCIRANQGHSIKIINPESLLNKLLRDELLSLPCIVHGTYPQAWESIKSDQTGGLKKMNRTHIHFATGLPADDGVISGMRKTCSIYIYLNATKCASDNSVDFYISDNGVVLTDGIRGSGVLPIDFFSHVTDSSGKILLDNR